jgi:hypothetical protein
MNRHEFIIAIQFIFESAMISNIVSVINSKFRLLEGRR